MAEEAKPDPKNMARFSVLKWGPFYRGNIRYRECQIHLQWPATPEALVDMNRMMGDLQGIWKTMLNEVSVSYEMEHLDDEIKHLLDPECEDDEDE